MDNTNLHEIKASLLRESKGTLDAMTEKIKDYEFYKSVINVLTVIVIAIQTVVATIVFISTVSSMTSSSSGSKSDSSSPFIVITENSSNTVKLSLLFTLLIIVVAYAAWLGLLLVIRTVAVSFCDQVIEKCRRNKAEGYRDIINLTERQIAVTNEGNDISQEIASDKPRSKYRIIPGTIRCRACGALNPDDAEICEKCGNTITLDD